MCFIDKKPTIPKTTLKEYVEKKSKGNEKVSYDTVKSSHGFISTVVCIDAGSVHGEEKPTKREAENSAATNALTKLNLI